MNRGARTHVCLFGFPCGPLKLRSQPVCSDHFTLVVVFLLVLVLTMLVLSLVYVEALVFLAQESKLVVIVDYLRAVLFREGFGLRIFPYAEVSRYNYPHSEDHLLKAAILSLSFLGLLDGRALLESSSSESLSSKPMPRSLRFARSLPWMASRWICSMALSSTSSCSLAEG